MGSRRISELQELTAPSSNDLVPIVDVSDGSTKRLPYGTLLAGPAAGVQIVDTFDVLSPDWVQQLGAIAVESGYAKGSSLSPAGRFQWKNPGFEDGVGTPWSHNATYVTLTAAAEERTGGTGVQCADLQVANAGEGNKYVSQLVMGSPIWGVTYRGSAWMRKTTEDAHNAELKIGPYGAPLTLAGSTASMEWQVISAEWTDTGEDQPYMQAGLPNDATVGVGMRVDDLLLELKAAIATRGDWYSEDVQIEAEYHIPATGPLTHAIVLRYQDANNYILVMPYFDESGNARLRMYQVIDGYWQLLLPYTHAITWDANTDSSLRVRLQGDVLCVDTKAEGGAWVNDVARALVTRTHSANHGIAILDTTTALINAISFSACPLIDRSTAGVYQQTIYIPGTMSANQSLRFTVPFACQILHVSAVLSNAGNSLLKLGHSADDDWYLQLTAFGQSNVPVTITAPDGFRFAITPTIAAGTTVVVTIDFDGASGTAGQNAAIVITYRSL